MSTGAYHDEGSTSSATVVPRYQTALCHNPQYHTSALNAVAVRYSETLAPTYQTAWRHNLEIRYMNICHHEHLKCCMTCCPEYGSAEETSRVEPRADKGRSRTLTLSHSVSTRFVATNAREVSIRMSTYYAGLQRSARGCRTLAPWPSSG